MSGAMPRLSAWTIYGDPVRGRSCGTCKACCTQVPVDLPTGHKPSNTRCRHLCSRGCSIYARRPRPCRVWSCRWLFDEDTAGLRRPDHSGYVIDAGLDDAIIDDHATELIQVWCDPDRRDAHRDPALRAYLAELGRVHALCTIVRWSSREGLLLVPPVLSKERDWLEIEAPMRSSAEMKRRLRDVGGPRPTMLRVTD